MSISCKSERSLLNHEELRAVRISHHPDIYGLDSKELHVLKVRFREQRDKARGLARHKQREMRGKAEPRGKASLEAPSSHSNASRSLPPR